MPCHAMLCNPVHISLLLASSHAGVRTMKSVHQHACACFWLSRCRAVNLLLSTRTPAAAFDDCP